MLAKCFSNSLSFILISSLAVCFNVLGLSTFLNLFLIGVCSSLNNHFGIFISFCFHFLNVFYFRNVFAQMLYEQKHYKFHICGCFPFLRLYFYSINLLEIKNTSFETTKSRSKGKNALIVV